MNRKARAAAAAMLVMALAGCAPEPVKVDARAGTRVTVINALEPTLANAHLGVTAFSTYVEPIENDWRLPQQAAQALVETLGKEGIEATALDVGSVDRDRLNNLNKLNRALNPRATGEDGMFRQWLLGVMHQTSASSLIVLHSVAKPFSYNSSFYYSSYGVLSALGFKPDSAILFVNTSALVVSGDGLIPAPLPNWKEGDCRRRVSTSGMKVDSLKDLKAADLEPFRAELSSMMVARLTQDLAVAGLVKSSVTPCYALAVEAEPKP